MFASLLCLQVSIVMVGDMKLDDLVITIQSLQHFGPSTAVVFHHLFVWVKMEQVRTCQMSLFSPSRQCQVTEGIKSKHRSQPET